MISIKNVIHVRQVDLTAMRQIISGVTQARIVLGGRVESYEGIMLGIAEEALMSLEAGKPLFFLGGFGGYDLSPTAVPAQFRPLAGKLTMPRFGLRK